MAALKKLLPLNGEIEKMLPLNGGAKKAAATQWRD